MKLKSLLFIIIIICIISCHKNSYKNDDTYDYIQTMLKISDCKNINLVKSILLNETGLEIEQEIQIITTDYSGGIPLRIEQNPIYYKVIINENQFNKYKKELLTGKYSNGWRFSKEKNELEYVRVDKYETACEIKKDIILFSFRNVEGIIP
jgi:hypothetical protein